LEKAVSRLPFFFVIFIPALPFTIEMMTRIHATDM
jgi:hypothetical protein